MTRISPAPRHVRSTALMKLLVVIVNCRIADPATRAFASLTPELESVTPAEGREPERFPGEFMRHSAFVKGFDI